MILINKKAVTAGAAAVAVSILLGTGGLAAENATAENVTAIEAAGAALTAAGDRLAEVVTEAGEEVADAASDARVLLRQIEFRTQGRDHPILPAAEETEYLKCGIYQVFPLNG